MLHMLRRRRRKGCASNIDAAAAHPWTLGRVAGRRAQEPRRCTRGPTRNARVTQQTCASRREHKRTAPCVSYISLPHGGKAWPPGCSYTVRLRAQKACTLTRTRHRDACTYSTPLYNHQPSAVQDSHAIGRAQEIAPDPWVDVSTHMSRKHGAATESQEGQQNIRSSCSGGATQRLRF